MDCGEPACALSNLKGSLLVRYRKGHKEGTRRTIIDQASTRYRQDGLSAVGLRGLMIGAGLTHGGFYAHFPSRADLIAAAIGAALQETFERLSDAVAKAAPNSGGEAFVDSYLSTVHRDRSDRGCAGAALAPEVARENSVVRKKFAEGIEVIVRLLAGQLPPGGTDGDRMNRAYGVFSLLMGALQLSRAVEDPVKSSEILAAGHLVAKAALRESWSKVN